MAINRNAKRRWNCPKIYISLNIIITSKKQNARQKLGVFVYKCNALESVCLSLRL